jgi:glutamate dehydrogenase
VQNNQGYYWDESEIDNKLRLMMIRGFENVYEIHQTRKVDMRLAAYMAGVRKMAEAVRFRGWV